MKKEITFPGKQRKRAAITPDPIEHGIFAEGDSIDELKQNIGSGIDCYFDNSLETPVFAHLHFVKR